MKKFIVMLLMSFILFVSNVYALEKEYPISDLGFNISFSEDWAVFTRDNYIGNEKLKEFQVTEEYVKNFFDTNDAYLEAIKSGMDFFIRSKPADVDRNLMDYSEKDLKSGGKAIIKENGAKSYEIIESNGIKYYKCSYKDKSYVLQLIEYLTIVNGNAITFTIQTAKGSYTDDEKIEIDNIIKSIKFDKINEYSFDETDTNNNFWTTLIRNIITGLVVGVVLTVIGVGTNNAKKKNKKIEEDHNQFLP